MNDLVKTLVEAGRKIQKEDPAFWETIPDGPIPPKGIIEQVCWTLKRYDLDDPAVRDLPHNVRCKMGR